MKPSQWLERRADFLTKEFRAAIERTDREFDPVVATAYTQALVDYLDEQYEIDQRRVALWTALALIGPGATIERTNWLLKKAGLDVEVKMSEPFETAKVRILAAAEKAGLA